MTDEGDMLEKQKKASVIAVSPWMIHFIPAVLDLEEDKQLSPLRATS